MLGPPTVGQSATPHVVGYMLHWGLFGALVVQVYVYYLAFPNDRLWLKCLVYGIALIETVQTGFMAHDAVMALGVGFGDPAALDNGHFGWLTVPLMTSIVSMMVQCFFAWRIYILSKIRVISVLIVFIALFQCSAGIAQAVISIRFNRYSLISQHAKATGTIWLVGATVCDVLIAITMTWTLSKSRKRTCSQRIDALLTRTIRLTIETGSATATMSVLTTVLFLALKQDDFFITSAYVLAKLYTNNLLMILNSRLHIDNGRIRRSLDDPSLISLRRPLPLPVRLEIRDSSKPAAPSDENNFRVIAIEPSGTAS